MMNENIILKVEGEVFKEVYPGKDGCEVLFPHVGHLVTIVGQVLANTGNEAWVSMEPFMDGHGGLVFFIEFRWDYP